MVRNTLQVLCVLALLGAAFQAPSAYGRRDILRDIIRKQQKKSKYRFSISSWFGTQEAKIKTQDLFFALNAPSPYEFFFGADYTWAKPPGGNQFLGQAFRLDAGAYVHIFGLQFNKEFRNDMWTGIFNLRVFGYHYQGTNITFQAGLRSQENPTIYRSPFVGGSVSIYVGRYFGFEGYYRYFMNPLTNTAGIETSGNRWEFSVFVDYRVLRVYGSYFIEEETVTAGSAVANNYSGLAAGIRFFF